jgi:hypothetical protein
VPLGRGEPLVLTSSVEFVAFLALVLRQGVQRTRRLACATRACHSLLSVLPLKKLREPFAGQPRDGQAAQLYRPLVRWRYLSLAVRSWSTRGALLVAGATLRVAPCRFATKCRGCD